MAEHAAAGPHREPPAPGRRDPRSARRAPRRRRVTSPASTRPRASTRTARRRCPKVRSSCSCCIGCASTGCGCSRSARASTTIWLPRETTAEAVVRDEHHRQATLHVSVANAITSLRLCSSLDWQQFFEKVSLVEQVLQRDPAGVYGRMDFLSRDRQRQAVEQLSSPTGGAQMRVALKAVESARRAAAAAGGTDRSAHVGYHLVGPGRVRLEADIGFKPRVAERVRARCFAHATAAYLVPIFMLTALSSPAASPTPAGRVAACAASIAAALLLLIPASDLAVAIVNRAVAWALPPRRLPRLQFADALPEDARTMVIVPTLLGSVRATQALVEHLEVLALGNLDARLHFAIVSDFLRRRCPAPAGRSGDHRRGAGRHHAAESAVRERPRRSLLLFPPRTAMERARTRMDGLGAQARQDRRVQPAAPGRHGDDVLRPGRTGWRSCRHVRYCLTLDTDTQTSSRRGQGTDRHHRPPAQSSGLRSRPRMRHRGLRHPPAARQRHAFERGRLAGLRGSTPVTRASIRTRRPCRTSYQDLFGEGIYAGKGLYDVDAFMAALANRVPENALLSHDLFEGLYARTALVSDVEVVDDYPSSVLAHARRQHRWVRGDWQILRWLFPYVPTRTGRQRNRLSADRPLEDPRQPAPQPRAAGPARAVHRRLVLSAWHRRRSGRCSRCCWSRSPSPSRCWSPWPARRLASAGACSAGPPWRICARRSPGRRSSSCSSRATPTT